MCDKPQIFADIQLNSQICIIHSFLLVLGSIGNDKAVQLKFTIAQSGAPISYHKLRHHQFNIKCDLQNVK